MLKEAVRLERGGLLDRALEQLSAAAMSDDPALAAEALRHRADIHRARCEWDLALDHARQSAALAEGAGQDELVAEALNAAAAVHMTRRDYDQAGDLLDRILALSSAPRVRGIALQNLGVIAAEEGRLEDARARFEESVERFRAADYARGVAMALVNTGRVALLGGDHTRAEELCAEGEAEAQRVGDLEIAAMAAFNRAEALVRGGRYQEAEAPASVALGYFTGVENGWRRMECLRLFGDLNRALGDGEVARQCYERGLDIARTSGSAHDVRKMENAIRALGDLEPGAGGREGADVDPGA